MNNGKIYCIGTDKKVYNFYYQNGACQFDALVANQNALVDARGGLTFDQTGKVFVIGTDGRSTTIIGLGAPGPSTGSRRISLRQSTLAASCWLTHLEKSTALELTEKS